MAGSNAPTSRCPKARIKDRSIYNWEELMNLKTCHLLCLLVVLLCGSLQALDNGDGTYSNPVIHADYPDCEIIRVGDDYYYLSSTFHFTPGNPMLHSKDLVNWKPVGHVIPDYSWDERYNLENGQNRYGAGSWAPTLRYHNGMFYAACFVWTQGNDVGRFMVTRSKSPEGPWQTNLIDEKLYDPGLLFADGKVYVVHGQNDIYVTELDADLRRVVTPARLVYEGSSYFEGAHAYKINGKYYLYCTGGGKQQCLRSDSIYGPYEHKTVCDAELNYPGTYVHQGGLVQTQKGDWWTMIFQDRGKHGRIPFLFPVSWEDGWPMVQPVWTHAKPDIDVDQPVSQENWRSDDFASAKLGLQWQWNHHAQNDRWSLTQRPGWLRLHATGPVSFLRQARNTLTQRIMGPDSGAVVKLDVSGVQEDDYAGLGIFTTDSSFIAVTRKNGQRVISLVRQPNQGGGFRFEEAASVPLASDTVWFKVEVPHLQYAVNYSYSLDGKTFTKLGDTLGIPYNFFSDWLAPRYAIFNYATDKIGGYVDVDRFEYILPARTNNLYHVGDTVDAQFCDATSRTHNGAFQWVEDGMENLYVQNPGQFRIGQGNHGPVAWTAAAVGKADGAWIKFNRIDFGDKAQAINVRVQGRGRFTVHLDKPDGPVIARGNVESDTFTSVDVPLTESVRGGGVHAIVIRLHAQDGSTMLLRQLTVHGK